MDHAELVTKLKDELNRSNLTVESVKFPADPVFDNYSHTIDLFLPVKRLAVDIHNKPITREGRTYYDTRLTDLYLNGFSLLEYTEKQVIEEFDQVVEEIVNFIPEFNCKFQRSDRAKRKYFYR